MHQEPPYHCNLLDGDGMVAASARLASKTVAEAISAADRFGREHPDCIEFEIRAADRLVYRSQARSR